MRSHQSLIDQLTLQEKASLLSGENFWNTKAIERLNIPSIMLTDGPHGLRKQDGKADHLGLNNSRPATCFPTAATLAQSWDRTLVASVGATIGREAAAAGVGVLLGPGLNIIRNPLSGRNFEYYSEDPLLAGKLASSSVQGIQSTGVAASPKHFAVNSQEHLRMSIDEVVDERSLHEIYLEAFRHVVTESKPRTIMSAYNRVNGTYANEHRQLLHDILKNEWGFTGVIVTDWGGNNDRVAGLIAGNQLEMPSTNGSTDHEVVAAVERGDVQMSLLDDRVNDLLELALHTPTVQPETVDYQAHHQRAVEAAERSMVLLKNEAETLPLRSGCKVAIIGDFAARPRYQGAGSSLVVPTQLDTALEALQQTHLTIIGYAAGFRRAGGRSRRLAREALALADQADITLLFLGLDEAAEAEGLDRPHMRLADAQLSLAAELSKQSTVVVVLAGGAPVELPFADAVPAIFLSGLGGQGSGQAIANSLTGVVNPSGKLAVTYPLEYQDVPSARYYPGKERTSEHREGIYVGYRYYDTRQLPVRFSFGHGLSYTSFSYGTPSGGPDTLRVKITNVGSVSGEEIVQVYVRPLASNVFRPARELAGFTKVQLEPGQSKVVEIELADHAYAYFNTERGNWVEEPGEYQLEVGASLSDIRGTLQVEREGEVVPSPYAGTDRFRQYYDAAVDEITPASFRALLGRVPPVARWDRRADITLDDTFAQLRYKNIFGRMVYGLLVFVRWWLFLVRRPIAANNVLFIMNLPFSKISRLSGGKVRQSTVLRLLRVVNW